MFLIATFGLTSALQVHRLRLNLRQNERQNRIQDCPELPVCLSHQQEKGEMIYHFIIAVIIHAS